MVWLREVFRVQNGGFFFFLSDDFNPLAHEYMNKYITIEHAFILISASRLLSLCFFFHAGAHLSLCFFLASLLEPWSCTPGNYTKTRKKGVGQSYVPFSWLRTTKRLRDSVEHTHKDKEVQRSEPTASYSWMEVYPSPGRDQGPKVGPKVASKEDGGEEERGDERGGGYVGWKPRLPRAKE